MYMEEGEEHWDTSYQKHYYCGSYLYKGIFSDRILWQDVGLKWKLNQWRGDLYWLYEMMNLFFGDNQM